MGESEQKDRTARLKLPADDETFWTWFDAQARPSLSIRLLVAKEVAANGCNSDVFWNQVNEVENTKVKEN